MGVVSGAAIQAGGEVTGVIPYAFIAAGGEADKTGEQGTSEARAAAAESKDDRVRTIIVDSMHERKIEMTKRSCGFVALPGGYGTWEEVCS
jgi:predicted Rossmann-fold nucleotide-binding protein